MRGAGQRKCGELSLRGCADSAGAAMRVSVKVLTLRTHQESTALPAEGGTPTFSESFSAEEQDESSDFPLSLALASWSRIVMAFMAASCLATFLLPASAGGNSRPLMTTWNLNLSRK